MAFLVQGVFFQKFFKSPTSYVVSAEKAAGQFLYGGALWASPKNPSQLIGRMEDAFGRSILFYVELSTTRLSFIKQYESRMDWIRYTFTIREEHGWLGEYSGRQSGNGVARCVLTEVPEEFFTPESALPLLGRKTAWEER